MNKLSLIVFSFLIIGMGGVSAVQEPEGWWNVTGNMTINSGFNITNEINITSGNITFDDNSELRVINSHLTLDKIFVIDDTIGNFTMMNSTLIGGNYQLLFDRYLNISFENSIIKDFLAVILGDRETNSQKAYLNNVTINSLGGSDNIIMSNGLYNLQIINSTFLNNTGSSKHGFYCKGCINLSVIGTEIYDVFGSSSAGISLTKTSASSPNVIGYSLDELNIHNTASHGIMIQGGSNNSIVKNSFIKDVGGYGIDYLDQSHHALVINNTVINASNGIMFSMGDGGLGNSTNFTSKNNKVYNITNYGIYFNTVIEGYSYDDYIYNATERCASTSNNATNINFYNLKLESCPYLSINSQVYSNNILYDNLTIINPNQSFEIKQTYNFTIKDSLNNRNENYYGKIINPSTGINFSNVNGYYFYLNNSQDLDFNLTNNYLYFKSVGSTTNIIQQSELSSALIFNTNNSIYCGGLVTGDCNITLPPNNASYVLDNFNLTEGVSRENSPISITEESDNQWNIRSNIIEEVAVDIIVSVRNCKTNGFTYKKQGETAFSKVDSSKVTCSGNTAIITDLTVAYALNSNELRFSPINTICDESDNSFLEAAALAGIMLTILLIAAAVGFLIMSFNGIIDIEQIRGISLEEVIAGILVIGLLFIVIATMAFLIGGNYCPAIT